MRVKREESDSNRVVYIKRKNEDLIMCLISPLSWQGYIQRVFKAQLQGIHPIHNILKDTKMHEVLD